MTSTHLATSDAVRDGQSGLATLSQTVHEEMVYLLREALAKYATCPERDERAANVLKLQS